jgi:hypothetical protein
VAEARDGPAYLDRVERDTAAKAAGVAALEPTWGDWIAQAEANPEAARQLLRKALEAGYSQFDLVLAGG